MTEAQMARVGGVAENIQSIERELRFWSSGRYMSAQLSGESAKRLREFLESELARLKAEAESL